MACAAEDEQDRVLCDAECTEKLKGIEIVTLPSGLQYQDIVQGKGPSPPTGYQASAAVSK